MTTSLVDLPDKDSMELHLPGPVLGLADDLGRVGTVLVEMEQVAVQDLLLGTVAGKEVEVEGIYSAVAGCSYSCLGTDTVVVCCYLPKRVDIGVAFVVLCTVMQDLTLHFLSHEEVDLGWHQGGIAVGMSFQELDLGLHHVWREGLVVSTLGWELDLGLHLVCRGEKKHFVRRD